MAGSTTLDGHLGEGTEVRGTLRFEGSVRIDGAFNGKIFSPATLILGPRARVEGEIQVGNLAVHGQLRGQVKASERITIHEQGRVEADLETDRLVIENGAYFNGTCDMDRPGAQRQASASDAPRPSDQADRGAAAGADRGSGGTLPGITESSEPPGE